MPIWRSGLGFGIGIAHAFAALGRIGFEGRFEYSAVGNVVNLAAGLCARADSDQLLIDPKVRIEIESLAEVEPAGEFLPKGFSRNVKAYNVLQASITAVYRERRSSPC